MGANDLQIPGIVQLWGKALIMPVKEGSGTIVQCHPKYIHVSLFFIILASNPPTPYQKQECVKSLQLLQMCVT